jgi:hypothetical protein
VSVKTTTRLRRNAAEKMIEINLREAPDRVLEEVLDVLASNDRLPGFSDLDNFLVYHGPSVKRTAWFLEHCTACGGNWTAMLGIGIKELWPDEFAALPEEFTVVDCLDVLKKMGVVLKEEK